LESFGEKGCDGRSGVKIGVSFGWKSGMLEMELRRSLKGRCCVDYFGQWIHEYGQELLKEPRGSHVREANGVVRLKTFDDSSFAVLVLDPM
jgi:hypothetical protein